MKHPASDAASGPIKTGEVVDNCRIEAVLGVGGFGAVYRAFHLGLEQPRAFKFLLPRPDAAEELRDRFLAEARHTARLSHPNIVIVHNVGEHAGLPFIHMEHLPGQSLRGRLRAGPPPAADALRVIDQVLAALDFAHARGYVHRDVKPDNVMEDEGGAVKLVDFGLSLNVVAQASRLTIDTGRPMGTPLYMAPEQWNSSSVGASADLWSVGVMLYEMLGGRHPFRGDDIREVMVNVLLRPHVPLIAVAPDVTTELSNLVDRLLSKDPAGRPATAREVRSALRGATASTTPAAPPPPVPPSLASEDEATPEGLVRLEGRPGRFRRECDGGVMALLPGGEFALGDDRGDADERPRRRVRLAAFLLDESPVTRRQFATFLSLWGTTRDDDGRALLDPELAGLRKNGAWWEPEEDDEAPVTGVTWYGAAEFARWAGVRLPTEAQLEYAMATLAAADGGERLKQLVGSVRFWCEDTYDERFYARAPAANPVNTVASPFRSVRGFSRWSGPLTWTRSRRDFAVPHQMALDLGFRCALPLTPAG